MDLLSAAGGASVVMVVGLIGKAAWSGLQRRNGVNALTAHDESAKAHPDIRKRLDTIVVDVKSINSTMSRMEGKLDRVLNNE